MVRPLQTQDKPDHVQDVFTLDLIPNGCLCPDKLGCGQSECESDKSMGDHVRSGIPSSRFGSKGTATSGWKPGVSKARRSGVTMRPKDKIRHHFCPDRKVYDTFMAKSYCKIFSSGLRYADRFLAPSTLCDVPVAKERVDKNG